jgi:hypothetical protein
MYADSSRFTAAAHRGGDPSSSNVPVGSKYSSGVGDAFIATILIPHAEQQLGAVAAVCDRSGESTPTPSVRLPRC